MHKQFSTVLPPFLMEFLGMNIESISRTWGDLCTLLAKSQNHYTLHITFAKMQDWIRAFGNWQYLKIMYNSCHKSKVIIRLRLNMNFLPLWYIYWKIMWTNENCIWTLANGGCFKDFPLITCTLLAKSHFIPQVIFAKVPDRINNFWQTTQLKIRLQFRSERITKCMSVSD